LSVLKNRSMQPLPSGCRTKAGEESDFVLKIIAHVNAAMVMTQSQTGGAARREEAEVFPYALSNRLQCSETGRFLHRMDTDAFGRAVIDSGEDRHRALGGREGGGRIGAPHLVGLIGSCSRLPRHQRDVAIGYGRYRAKRRCAVSLGFFVAAG